MQCHNYKCTFMQGLQTLIIGEQMHIHCLIDTLSKQKKSFLQRIKHKLGIKVLSVLTGKESLQQK